MSVVFLLQKNALLNGKDIFQRTELLLASPNGSINSDWLTLRAISAVFKSAVGRLFKQHHSGIASRLSL